MPLLLVKTVGGTKSKQLQVAQGITGASLHMRVAALTGLLPEKLKVVLHGKVVPAEGNEVPSLRDGASSSEEREEDAEDELVFRLPPSASWAERKVAAALKRWLRLPDYALVAFFCLSLRTWALLFAWCLVAPLAQRWDLGPPYTVVERMLFFVSCGSAYSIFNANFEELPGTLNAERLDRDIRGGQF